jgi:hypothetical protein
LVLELEKDYLERPYSAAERNGKMDMGEWKNEKDHNGA